MQVKIGILSDTHGWLDPSLETWFADVDMILHAGDAGNEAVLDALRAIAPTVAVRGNVDGGAWARELPMERVEEVAGRRIAMRHIAGTHRKPNAEARALIARERPDVFVCGHSHILVAARYEGTLWLNPGAAGRQGWQVLRTAFILTVAPDAEMELHKIDLGKR